MASTTKSRTITYLRATWPEGNRPNMTLQGALEICLDALPKVVDTRIELRRAVGIAGNVATRHKKANKSLFFLHVAAWTDRESASIVPDPQNRLQADLGTSPPGKDWDYLDGDGMILVSKDHCLIMPSGLSQPTLERYIRKLLEYARDTKDAPLPDKIEDFHLTPVANEQKIKKIVESGGIKKIQMNISQYLETARDSSKVKRTKLICDIGREVLESLVKKESDRNRIKEADNVTARLFISLDGRRSGLKPEALGKMLKRLPEESPDEIEIETGTGEKIKRGSLIIRKSVEVKADAKTVEHKDAWREMENYFSELKRAGVLSL